MASEWMHSRITFSFQCKNILSEKLNYNPVSQRFNPKIVQQAKFWQESSFQHVEFENNPYESIFRNQKNFELKVVHLGFSETLLIWKK